MTIMVKGAAIVIAVMAWCATAGATDLTLHLKGSQPMSRSTMQYECDAEGAKMGLPPGVFSVEYLNGAGNSLGDFASEWRINCLREYLFRIWSALCRQTIHLVGCRWPLRQFFVRLARRQDAIRMSSHRL